MPTIESIDGETIFVCFCGNRWFELVNDVYVCKCGRRYNKSLDEIKDSPMTGGKSDFLPTLIHVFTQFKKYFFPAVVARIKKVFSPFGV